MPAYFRMCRFSGDVLPVSDFTIDQWDCDRVCRQDPFGPKSAPRDTSYTIRQKVKNETKVVQEGLNPHDEPAWRALFNLIDDDQSGYIGAYEMVNYLERIAGKFDWQDDGDGKMDFYEFVDAMTKRLPASTEMAVKMYAHSLIGRDLTTETSYPTEQKSNSKAKKTASFRGQAASINVDDRANLKKLFNFIDTSGSGQLSRKTVQTKLAGMLGSFEWKDDGDGTMDVDEFIEAMRHVAPSTRLTAVMYAQSAL
eukprot:TRINITY_DN4909_c0_g1_i1.p1 TRINITY_DN4909_c0_g1~~TRINITY_DN4909_c0_g1_i1.p1  ORF type:complete len:267 (+),score=95.20 TRINITY_DN4909_c0_g1_i1:43-801(+)